MRRLTRASAGLLAEMTVLAGVQASVLYFNFSTPRWATKSAAVTIWAIAALVSAVMLNRRFGFSLAEFLVVTLCFCGFYFVLTPGVHVHRPARQVEHRQRQRVEQSLEWFNRQYY
jgi:hypothetical protein